MATIILDPGHDSSTAGKRSPKGHVGIIECDFALSLALRIQDALLSDSNLRLLAPTLNVVLTRKDGKYISLKNRCAIANALRVPGDIQIFNSLHANATGSGAHWENDRSGVRIFTKMQAPAETVKLASILGPKIAVAMGIPFIGIRDHITDKNGKNVNLAMCVGPKMTAILTEHGFMDTEVDAAKMADQAIQEAIVQAHCAAYREYIEWAKSKRG